MTHSSWRHAPQSRAGRLAQSLLIGFFVLFIVNQLNVALLNDLRNTAMGQIASQLPVAVWIAIGFGMLGVGLAASISAVIAVIRHHERSWVLWLALLPGLFVVFLLVGEFLIAPFD
jgi:hypothetical protein